MAAKDTGERPNCFACQAFLITHEPETPYGCRAFGMKSRNLPSLAVFQSSGQDCQLFAPKPPPPPAPTR